MNSREHFYASMWFPMGSHCNHLQSHCIDPEREKEGKIDTIIK